MLLRKCCRCIRFNNAMWTHVTIPNDRSLINKLTFSFNLTSKHISKFLRLNLRYLNKNKDNFQTIFTKGLLYFDTVLRAGIKHLYLILVLAVSITLSVWFYTKVQIYKQWGKAISLSWKWDTGIYTSLNWFGCSSYILKIDSM